MKAIVLVAIISTSAAASLSVKEVVDNLFDKYLPQKATWEEVKACRGKCNKDVGCIEACPKYQCPFQRIAAQCDGFNSSMADAKACHHGCGHDFSCHFKCPKAQPTTIKELKMVGQAMVCHKQCGHDHECHKACCQDDANPWAERQARCEKLHTTVMCHHSGASPSTCPHLDEKTKTELMQEPWSLVKDIANHVADYLLPLPEGQEVSVEEVKACHTKCASDAHSGPRACHRNCPKGVFGRFHDKCNTLQNASGCHQTCEDSETKCPFKKMKCHHKCPMSMPTSVKELKGLVDHVECHSTCGQDKECHKACPNSNWDEKKVQCKQYDDMVACHKQCAGDGTCHASCPQLSDQILNDVKQEPTNIAKDVIDVLVV